MRQYITTASLERHLQSSRQCRVAHYFCWPERVRSRLGADIDPKHEKVWNLSAFLFAASRPRSDQSGHRPTGFSIRPASASAVAPDSLGPGQGDLTLWFPRFPLELRGVASSVHCTSYRLRFSRSVCCGCTYITLLCKVPPCHRLNARQLQQYTFQLRLVPPVSNRTSSSQPGLQAPSKVFPRASQRPNDPTLGPLRTHGAAGNRRRSTARLSILTAR